MPVISKKEYKDLLRLKKKLDFILKNVVIKDRKEMTALDLLDLAKLKIKGGPKDLSDSSRNSHCAFL
jgi:hypothetical protein